MPLFSDLNTWGVGMMGFSEYVKGENSTSELDIIFQNYSMLFREIKFKSLMILILVLLSPVCTPFFINSLAPDQPASDKTNTY